MDKCTCEQFMVSWQQVEYASSQDSMTSDWTEKNSKSNFESLRKLWAHEEKGQWAITQRLCHHNRYLSVSLTVACIIYILLCTYDIAVSQWHSHCHTYT